MLSDHKGELICDLAEYYHIYDYHSVPCRLLGTLTAGLRAESRVGMIRGGVKADPSTIMLIRIYDALMQVFGSKDHEPMLKGFIIEEKPKSDYRTYKSGEDFMRAWSDANRR